VRLPISKERKNNQAFKTLKYNNTNQQHNHVLNIEINSSYRQGRLTPPHGPNSLTKRHTLDMNRGPKQNSLDEMKPVHL
jgi:hypothetical protein